MPRMVALPISRIILAGALACHLFSITTSVSPSPLDMDIDPCGTAPAHGPIDFLFAVQLGTDSLAAFGNMTAAMETIVTHLDARINEDQIRVGIVGFSVSLMSSVPFTGVMGDIQNSISMLSRSTAGTFDLSNAIEVATSSIFESDFGARAYSAKVMMIMYIDTDQPDFDDAVTEAINARRNGILVFAADHLGTSTGTLSELPGTTVRVFDFTDSFDTLFTQIYPCVATCDYPDIIPNGIFSSTNTRTLEGSVIGYTCNTGYFTSDVPFRLCTYLDTGVVWYESITPSDDPPQCNVVDCPSVTLTDGMFQYHGNQEYLDVVTYICNSGYRIDGPSVRYCTAGGSWSLADPTCDAVTCDLLQPEDPLMVTFNSGQTFGSIATYSCSSNRYNLIGSPTRTCGNNGWSGLEPYCQPITCEYPEEIGNGYFTNSGMEIGHTVTYDCNTGFTLIGNSMSTCTSTGWNGTRECSEITCTTLPPIPNGEVFNTGTAYGSSAVLICEEGYVATSGSLFRCTGTLTGMWESPNPLMCNLVDCGAPGSGPTYSSSVTTTTYLSEATYTCIAGYTLVGSATTTCQSDGSWSGPEPLCLLVDCGRPPSVENGYVSIPNGTTFGDTVLYGCDSGYFQPGSVTNTRMCQADGTWSGVVPPCLNISCGDPGPIASGTVDLSRGTNYIAIINYECNPGYQLEGTPVRQCDDNGNWSDTAPTCQRIDCYHPGELLNGQVDVDSTVFEAIANFTCNEGYDLVGVNERICEENGRWSSQQPYCRIIDCGSLAPVSNGDIVYENTAFQSTAVYSCDPGYELTTAYDVVMCLSSGSWNETTFPECQVVDCGTAPVVLNASPDSSPGSTYKSVVHYTCDTGYTMPLDTPSIVSCQADGTWSDAPNCTIVRCQVPASPTNGAVNMDNGIGYSSEITYTCMPGYQLVGTAVQMCQSNGFWSATPPTCQAIDCGGLDSIQNGDITYSSGTAFNSVATHSCDDGYMLDSANTRTCLNTGAWSGSAPGCQVADCSTPSMLTNGMDDTSRGTTYQSVAIYTCDAGYRINGDVLVACEASETWSTPTSQPMCTVIDCGSLRDITNGYVNTSDGTDYGSVAKYTCLSGYYLVGSDNRTCLANGHWSSNEPYCRAVNCGSLPNIENGWLSYTLGTSFMSSAEYRCDFGYTLDGTASGMNSTALTCEDDGSWSDSVPICQAIDCGTPSVPINGTVDTSRGTTFGQFASFSCEPGFLLEPPLSRQCLPDGTWFPSEPQCQRVVCEGFSDSLENGNVTVSVSGTAYREVVNYACDMGYNLVGSAGRICQEDGTLSGRQPVCSIIVCQPLSPVENGDVIFSEGNNLQSVASYSCNTGYQLIGNEQRTCQLSGDWNGTEPMCMPLDCGQPNQLTNGTVSISKDTTYKSIVFYECDIGFILIGPMLRSCLINDTSVAWSESDPYCQIVDCGAPPVIANGAINNDTGHTYLAVITYTCEVGYELNGARVRTCQADGKWSDPDPTCPLVDCGMLEMVANAQIEYSNGTSTVYQSNATYICDPDHELIRGSEMRTCQADGNWSGNAATCVVPLPPFNGSCSALNESCVQCIFNYSHSVRRDCEVVYRRLPSDDPNVDIPALPSDDISHKGGEEISTPLIGQNELEICVSESGTYEFQIRCNSTVGFTDFTLPFTAEVDEQTCSTVFECNPALIYAVIVPIAAVVVGAIVAVLIFIGIKFAKK